MPGFLRRFAGFFSRRKNAGQQPSPAPKGSGVPLLVSSHFEALDRTAAEERRAASYTPQPTTAQPAKQAQVQPPLQEKKRPAKQTTEAPKPKLAEAVERQHQIIARLRIENPSWYRRYLNAGITSPAFHKFIEELEKQKGKKFSPSRTFDTLEKRIFGPPTANQRSLHQLINEAIAYSGRTPATPEEYGLIVSSVIIDAIKRSWIKIA